MHELPVELPSECQEARGCHRKSRHGNIPRYMTVSNPTSQYVLGSTDAEHERLMRQAARLDPYTERLFRDAGIGSGQRVLDIGSGVGDVAMLAARLVGSSGEVVGVERDIRAITKARARVAEAELHNVTFVHSDVSQVTSDKSFDAAVGRFILQFLPEPGTVLRSLSKLIRPGGVLAFHEPTWSPLLLFTAHLPLWSACTSLIQKTFQRSGANTEMEVILFRAFGEAGLPTPSMLMEMAIGSDSYFPRWVYDLLCSIRPQMQHHNLPYEALGDFDTLLQRLEAELVALQSPGACIALVGAWSRPSIPAAPR
jgi:2-polyprenyl-3-methyl-5-hydroxy-6-metoxy-1,4-benzoquinol methylase